MEAGIKLAPLLTDIRVNIQEFKADMSEVASVAVDEARNVSKGMEKVANTGEKMKDIGSKATKFITLPIMAAGTALGKMAFDTENDLSSLQGRLGATKEETESLKKVSKDIYNDGFGESLESCVNDLVLLQQNLVSTKNWSDETKTSILEQVNSMNKLFDTSTDELTRTLAVMQNSGLDDDIQHAMDVLTTGFQNGANYSGELLDTMREYSPQFVKLGLDSEEAMNYLITGAQNGAFNLDKVGDAMKELSIRVIDGSDTTIDGFNKIGLNADNMAKKFANGGDSAKQAFKEVLQGLANIKDPVKQSIAGVDLFGTMWEDLGPQVITSLAGVEGGLKDVNGATLKAGEGINNSIGNQFTVALREAKEAVMPLAVEVLKLAKDALPTIKEVISDVTDVLKDLSPETKQMIIKIGLMAAAFGPLTSGVGNAITMFGKFGSGMTGLIGNIGKYIPSVGKFASKIGIVSSAATEVGATAGIAGGAAGVGGLVTSLGSAAIAAAPFVAAGAAVVGAGYLIHKELSKEVIPTVDLYADRVTNTASIVKDSYGNMAIETQANTVKISEATESAVQSYMDMDDKVTKSLYEQKVKQDVVTKDMTDSMISQFSYMGEKIKTSQQQKYNEMNTDLTNFFSENSSLTETREAEILGIVQQKHQEQIATVDNAMARISEIYNIAKEQNRKLKNEELIEIQTLQNQMRDSAINTLSETEQEAAVIRERMKDYQGRLTAEMASEMITKANETRDGEIKAAEEKYEGIIKQAARLKEAGYITEAEYRNMVDQAKTTKEEQINKAREANEGIKREIQSATPGIADAVNTQTGEIKSKYTKLKESIGNFFSWLFSSNDEAAKNATDMRDRIYGKSNGSHYNGLSYVPFDGYTATLHKGERVLTAKENKDYISGDVGSSTTINFNGSYKFNDRNDIDYFMNQAAIRIKGVR